MKSNLRKKVFALGLISTMIAWGFTTSNGESNQKIDLQATQADDIVSIKSITAGSSYPDAAIDPRHLISLDGMSPANPTDLSSATYRRSGYNCWHTKGDNNNEAWLLIEFNKAENLDKLYVWNLNQTDENGTRDIKDVMISYSEDSMDGLNGSWNELGNYTIDRSKGDGSASTVQTIIPMNVKARYIKIKATSSYGSIYWGLGKLFFSRGAGDATDQAMLALKHKVTEAEAIAYYLFSHESWKPLHDAVTAAKVLVKEASSDLEAIQAATQAITDKMASLVTKQNLTSGAQATASSVYKNLADYNGAKTVDGNMSTRWATEENATDYSLDITLSEAKTFNQILIIENSSYSIRLGKITIKVSEDGTNWTIWRTKYGNIDHVSAVGEMQTARYLRVEFKDCDSRGINIDEVMVFNDPSAIETKDPTLPREEDPNWIKQPTSTSENVFQKRKADLKYGMFIHYGINTFLESEWTDGSQDASEYNPNLSTLDPESWIKAAWEGGMNFVVLITKHHEGFALWNTEVGTYNINHTGRDGDKRDIVKEVADACKKYGIKLGLYYSSWDRNWDRNNTMESTGLDRVGLNQAYNDFALAQITELLDGRYGEICEFWIDGAWEKSCSTWEFARMYNTVKTLQPSCQFGINCTIKNPNSTNHVYQPDQMTGGEEMLYYPSDFRLMDPFFTRKGPDADPKVYKQNGKDVYLPFEATICINNAWFWNSKQNEGAVKSPQYIKDAYNHMVEQRNTLVLNLSPNRNGVLEQWDINGLYAAARTLGIARGNARLNAQPNECAVEIRYLTNSGNIAYPTRYIYGESGQSYTVTPDNFEAIGYQYQGSNGSLSGTFSSSKVVIELIYKDTAQDGSTVIDEKNTDSLFKVWIENRRVKMMGCSESFKLYTIGGVRLDPKSELSKGAYFIVSGDNTSKLMVP